MVQSSRESPFSRRNLLYWRRGGPYNRGMAKILVFGATGEIGGRIARGCVDAGHQVTGVTRGTNTRARPNLDGVEFLVGDKEDEAFMRKLGASTDAEIIIDSIPKVTTLRLYHRYFRNVKNVFFCSSTGTFVPLQYFPGDERHPWRKHTPVNFYQQCLRDAEALDLWERKGFPVTIFRPTNIIGRGRVPLELWGGRNIEFYRKLKRNEPVYIPPCDDVLVQSGFNDDLAMAFVKGVEHAGKVRGEIFVISCKRAIRLGRYLQVAMDYLGSRSPIHRVPPDELCAIYPEINRKGLEFLLEPMCFDIGKAEKVLGYQPTRTTEEGLVEALKWCEEAGLL